MSTMREEAIVLARQFIEHAPRFNPKAPVASDLLGFLGADNLFLCSRCAGRILARGCSLNRIANVPVWTGANPPPEPCCLADTHDPS